MQGNFVTIYITFHQRTLAPRHRNYNNNTAFNTTSCSHCEIHDVPDRESSESRLSPISLWMTELEMSLPGRASQLIFVQPAKKVLILFLNAVVMDLFLQLRDQSWP
jgi:hypothetical protein